MKTFIGELILRLQTPGTDKAKKLISTLKDVDKAARNVGKGGSRGLSKMQGQMAAIERHAKSLSSANWGVSYQRQLERLGLSKREFQAVGKSWNRLQTNIRTNNMKKSLKASNISAWKTATLSHFAAVRAGMAQTEARSKRFAQNIQKAIRPAYVMLGGYTGVYMAGIAGRAAFGADSDRKREHFRQDMASIPKGEQGKIFRGARGLNERYPSVGITDTMEMARMARNLMGNTERGLKILENMVKGLVVMQSSKGMEAATPEIIGLLRGLDNLGKNSGAQVGIDNVNNLIEALVKASQIEGMDLDLGQLFTFARRSKIAGPGLSAEFLSTVAPALIQDMTAAGAGTALSSAYKAYVIGAKDTASKVNLAEQRRIGIKKGDNLVGATLFGQNPYEWVKKYLVPALKKDGIDLSNETAVAKAISKTSRNSKATGALTRMVTQQDQIDRNVALYQGAQGLKSADNAALRDPRVAARALSESLQSLSAATLSHVDIASRLTSIAGSISKFSELVRQGDSTVANSAMAIGGVAGAYGIYKGVKGIRAIFMAGPALLSSAAALEAAAISLGGGGMAGGAAGAAGVAGATKKGLLSRIMGAGARVVKHPYALGAMAAIVAAKGAYDRGMFSRPNDPLFKHKRPAQLTKHRAASANKGAGSAVSDMLGAIGLAKDLDKALSIDAKIDVNKQPIDAALATARQLKAILDGIASSASAAGAKVNSELRRSMSDYGVAP